MRRKVYEQYIVMFPTGEKIESAYLNIIDALREAGKYDEANSWVDKATQRFSGMPVETNALQARLRMEIYRQNWTNAVKPLQTACGFRTISKARWQVFDEINYLKAFALEKLGRKTEAIARLFIDSRQFHSYYGGLATEKLKILSPQLVKKTASVSSSFTKDFPAPFRAELLRYAKSKNVDPRFVLAIMKQESQFPLHAPNRLPPLAGCSSSSLIRRSNTTKKPDYPNLQADDLYNPATNIAIGSLYICRT